MRRAVLIASVVVTAWVAWVWGPSVWRLGILLQTHRRCLAVAVPGNKVTLDNDPRNAAPLIAADPQYVLLGSAGPVVWFCKDWERLIAEVSPPGRRPCATVFIGDRFTPAGKRCLVVVEATCEPVANGNGVVRLLGTTMIGSERRVVRTGLFGVPFYFDASTAMRLFAGQRDPSDPTHFTIAYQADGGSGTIDGWLRDDGTVILDRRRSVTPPPPPSAASPQAPG
jgi:hypothetical protein